MNIWADAISLTVEMCETEDGFWLHPVNDAQHINLALHWQANVLDLQTNSLCVLLKLRCSNQQNNHMH